jgi:hypothetical protein
VIERRERREEKRREKEREREGSGSQTKVCFLLTERVVERKENEALGW